MAFLSEEPALLLTNTTSRDEFVEQARNGKLTFQRGHLRLRRAPTKEQIPKLTIVCAKTRLFELPLTLSAPAHDSRVVPTKLSAVSGSTSGKLAIDVGGHTVLAAGALVVIKATKDADTIQREGGFGIKNFVQDMLETDPQAKGKVYHAVTSCVVARLNRYALSTGTAALIHVTGIADGELVVADVWHLQGDNPDISTFAEEVAASTHALKNPATLKRKAANMDDIFPVPKKMYPAFDTPSSD